MMEKNLSLFTYIAAFFSSFLGFLNNNAAALGVIIAFCTLIINWWYQHRRSRYLHNQRKDD